MGENTTAITKNAQTPLDARKKVSLEINLRKLCAISCPVIRMRYQIIVKVPKESIENMA